MHVVRQYMVSQLWLFSFGAITWVATNWILMKSSLQQHVAGDPHNKSDELRMHVFPRMAHVRTALWDVRSSSDFTRRVLWWLPLDSECISSLHLAGTQLKLTTFTAVICFNSIMGKSTKCEVFSSHIHFRMELIHVDLNTYISVWYMFLCIVFIATANLISGMWLHFLRSEHIGLLRGSELYNVCRLLPQESVNVKHSLTASTPMWNWYRSNSYAIEIQISMTSVSLYCYTITLSIMVSEACLAIPAGPVNVPQWTHPFECVLPLFGKGTSNSIDSGQTSGTSPPSSMWHVRRVSVGDEHNSGCEPKVRGWK